MSSTMSVREAFWRQWRNGGRRTIIVSAACLVVLMLVNTVLLVSIVRDGPVLANVVPQEVLTPEVRAGDVLVTRGTKCNRTDKPVVVFSTSYIAPVDPPGRSELSSQGSAVREPGCVTREFKRTIAPGTAPGLYRIGGSDTVVNEDGEVSTAGWYSELYRVLDAQP